MEQQTWALVVNDDADMLWHLQDVLEQQRVQVQCARNVKEALAALASGATAEIIFTGSSFSDGTWRDVLTMAQAADPPSAVVLVTRVEDIRTYLDAMSEGACDYIVPPFSEADVGHIVRNALLDLTLHRPGSAFARAV